jgi:hypothetical protein
MQQLAHKELWKTVFVIVVFVFSTTALGTAGWFRVSPVERLAILQRGGLRCAGGEATRSRTACSRQKEPKM